MQQYVILFHFSHSRISLAVVPKKSTDLTISVQYKGFDFSRVHLVKKALFSNSGQPVADQMYTSSSGDAYFFLPSSKKKKQIKKQTKKTKFVGATSGWTIRCSGNSSYTCPPRYPSPLRHDTKQPRRFVSTPRH